jgi:hypothetical protein
MFSKVKAASAAQETAMSNAVTQFELEQLAYEALQQAAQLVADLEYGKGTVVSEVLINTHPTLTAEEQIIDAFLAEAEEELDAVPANVVGEGLTEAEIDAKIDAKIDAVIDAFLDDYIDESNDDFDAVDCGSEDED